MGVRLHPPTFTRSSEVGLPPACLTHLPGPAPVAALSTSVAQPAGQQPLFVLSNVYRRRNRFALVIKSRMKDVYQVHDGPVVVENPFWLIPQFCTDPSPVEPGVRWQGPVSMTWLAIEIEICISSAASGIGVEQQGAQVCSFRPLRSAKTLQIDSTRSTKVKAEGTKITDRRSCS
jgi:hypothetical protein